MGTSHFLDNDSLAFSNSDMRCRSLAALRQLAPAAIPNDLAVLSVSEFDEHEIQSFYSQVCNPRDMEIGRRARAKTLTPKKEFILSRTVARMLNPNKPLTWNALGIERHCRIILELAGSLQSISSLCESISSRSGDQSEESQ